jgi:hypothetical protein
MHGIGSIRVYSKEGKLGCIFSGGGVARICGSFFNEVKMKGTWNVAQRPPVKGPKSIQDDLQCKTAQCMWPNHSDCSSTTDMTTNNLTIALTTYT